MPTEIDVDGFPAYTAPIILPVAGFTQLNILGGTLAASLANLVDATKPLTSPGTPIVGGNSVRLDGNGNHLLSSIADTAALTMFGVAKAPVSDTGVTPTVATDSARILSCYSTSGTSNGFTLSLETNGRMQLTGFYGDVPTTARNVLTATPGNGIAARNSYRIAVGQSIPGTGLRVLDKTLNTSGTYANTNARTLGVNPIRVGGRPALNTGSEIDVALVAWVPLVLTDTDIDFICAFIREEMAAAGITA